MGAFEFQELASGCVFHVNTTGNDDNSGLTWTNAFGIIQPTKWYLHDPITIGGCRY